MTRPEEKFLLDMLLAARQVQAYMHDVDRKAFDTNQLLQDAVVRRLEIVGEAAAQISIETRNSYQHIPWREIVGMRNRLIHEYFQVDVDIVWTVVQRDLPELIEQLQPLVPQEDDA